MLGSSEIEKEVAKLRQQGLPNEEIIPALLKENRWSQAQIALTLLSNPPQNLVLAPATS